MFISQKHLPRRTVLRGLGASLALPLLDGMVPAYAALRKTAANPVRRLGVCYVPNGMEMRAWTPAGDGRGFDFSQILRPLEAFRSQVNVLTGLADKVAVPRPGEGIGDHARASATFLTGVHVKKTEGADIRAGISMDQIAAQQLGAETQLASLELGVDSVETLGACDAGYSCAYTNTIAWRTATTPLPMENDPRAVFERLFGTSGSTDPAARLARMRKDRSVLDAVNEELSDLEREIGPGDRLKLDEYLSAVRDAERRIEMAERQNTRELPLVDQPIGTPNDYAEHAKLMMDLLALAYQTDLTRISTFMLAREVSARAYPEIGVSDSHHPLSHHQDKPANLERLHKVNEYHFRQFAHLVRKLAATPEGDGTMLDSTLLLYGTGISDSNTHFHDDLPVALIAGKATGVTGGRYVRYPRGTPIANLYITILDKMGFPLEKFGDSTGMLKDLSV